MAFTSRGFLNQRQVIYGLSTDDINTAVKIQGALLWLEDTNTWKTYSGTSGWIDWTGDPVQVIGNMTLGGTVAISQVTDGTTNKVQARNAVADNFLVNANMQFSDIDISGTRPLPTKDGFLASTPVTIYSAISATPASPFELVVKDLYQGIKIITSGTSTSRTIAFNAKLNVGDTYRPFSAFNWSTGSDFTFSTTGNNEIWEITGFTGVYSIQINVTAIAGGNLTILGQLYS